MADAPTLSLKQLRDLVTDSGELAKGARIVDDGALLHLARHEHKLFAEAAGSATYKVQIIFDDKGPRARCSCMAARSRPFCKHAAALLVAWQRTPEAFALAEAPPAGAEPTKKKAVKVGKVETASLMATGVAQVATLVRELAVAGAATSAGDRPAQVRALGENLREQKLRRLSAKTVALADLLTAARAGGDAFDDDAYAELLGDLLLTARKLEKHLAGEALDPRHVEELVGKTWTKKDRAPVTDLDLVEVAFGSRETADGFVIRESRFIELRGGAHYAEKQILPAFLAKRTPPKPSWAGVTLAGAFGSLYPSYPPLRLDLDGPAAGRACTPADLEALLATALPTVKAAVAALAEHRKDVFAPDALPTTVACDGLIADRGRLQLADAGGGALFLPDDDAAADRLATALAGVSLRAVVGDLSLEGALPILTPLAVVVSGRHGLELRSLGLGAVGAPVVSRKHRARPTAATAARASWTVAARAMGLSTAAIALGEVRTEMAGLLLAGLSSVTPRRTEALVARLRELGMAKQADLLAELATRADAAERLDDFIKLHQVLGIALARLTGGASVDRGELVASPTYASVLVRRTDARPTPGEIALAVARGDLNRFEAAARYAAHYDALPAEALVTQLYPTWADGSASPFVARAATREPAAAIEMARALLLAGAGVQTRSEFVARARGAHPRMALLTAVRVLEAVGGDDALAALRAASQRCPDQSVRALAEAALHRLAGTTPGTQGELAQLRGDLLNASDKTARAEAADTLAARGDAAAIPLLRQAFLGDIAALVRDHAGRALARLGDADSVDTFIALLARRDDDADSAKTAAYALGILGDVRGIGALLSAFEDAWRVEIVTDALAALGVAVIPTLLDFVTERPGLLKRASALNIVAQMPGDDLRDATGERLAAIPADETGVHRAAVLLTLVKHRPDVGKPLAREITTRFAALGGKTGSKEARALLRTAEHLLTPPSGRAS